MIYCVLHFHHDFALVVRSGDWKLEAIVGTAAVEYADGMVDGETKDGAGAGGDGDASG